MKLHVKLAVVGVITLQSISYADAYIYESCLNPAEKSCKTPIYSDNPEKENIAKGEKIIKDVKNSRDDKERWALVTLFSGSGDDEIQSVDLIKSKNFSMTLDPRKGWLTFSTGTNRQSFMIAKPDSGPDELCPNYQVRAIEAASGYAIINKICPKNEYRPGRFYMSNDYYLFVQRSNTLRSIWSAAVTTKAKFPAPRPEIHVTQINRGYEFKWAGMFPGDGTSRKISISNLYKIETNQKGGVKLVCYDASNRNNLAKEGDMCRGEVLDQIAEIPSK
jgi:hypothetical protein